MFAFCLSVLTARPSEKVECVAGECQVWRGGVRVFCEGCVVFCCSLDGLRAAVIRNLVRYAFFVNCDGVYLHADNAEEVGATKH